MTMQAPAPPYTPQPWYPPPAPRSRPWLIPVVIIGGAAVLGGGFLTAALLRPAAEPLPVVQQQVPDPALPPVAPTPAPPADVTTTTAVPVVETATTAGTTTTVPQVAESTATTAGTTTTQPITTTTAAPPTDPPVEPAPPSGEAFTLGTYQIVLPDFATVASTTETQVSFESTAGVLGIAASRTSQKSIDAAVELVWVIEGGSWFSPDVYTNISYGDPYPIAFTVGSGALAYYEATYTTQDGTFVEHGALFVHVRPDGEVLLVDNYQPGPAPPTDAEWAPIDELVNAVIAGVIVA